MRGVLCIQTSFSNSEDTMEDLLSPMLRTFNGVDFNYRFMVAGGVVIFELGSVNTTGSSGNGGRDYHAEYKSYDILSATLLLNTSNSLGLPNPGMDYIEEGTPRYLKVCTAAGMPSWINISGNGVEDTLSLLGRAFKAGYRVITVNGACPNKIDQPILCDDPASVDEFFDRVDQEFGDVTDRVILWKVSCGMRRPALAHNRERFRKSRAVIGVITGNTIPNSLDYLPDGRTVIATANSINRGGLAGPAILPIALDHTEFMMQDLPPGKFGIGCGGAMDAVSASKFIRAGATFVQSNSAVLEAKEDPDFVRDVNFDLINQFKGLMS
jgi:dihydroorotate dehydrogenase